MKTALIAVAVLLSAACGKTYQEIGTFPCAEDHTCPDTMKCILINGSGRCMEDLTCSPGTQSCPPGDATTEASRTRCTLLKTAPGLVESQCTHQYGAAPPGSTCQLLFNGTSTGSAFGVFDNFPYEDRFCANGSICHSLSMSPPATINGTSNGTCRTFCTSDAGCGSGEGCLDAFHKTVTSATVSVSPRVGVCYPTCTLMAASGNGGCGVGESCQVGFGLAANSGLPICQAPSGNVAEGATCDSRLVCNAGLSCVPSGSTFKCEKLCRVSQGATPCKAGQTCVKSALALADPDIGFCQ